MKKNILFILAIMLLSVLPAQALYWGTTENYEGFYDNYALPKILNNMPIRYYLIAEKPQDFDKEENSITNQLKQKLSAEKEIADDLNTMVITAFNTWFTDTKAMIQNKGRAKEFSDIIPLLHPINLKRVYNEDEADITIVFTDEDSVEDSCGDAYGCFSFNEKNITVINPYIITGESFEQRRNFNLAILIHELGHYFGLTDQYQDYGNSSITHSSHRIGNHDSVMASSKELNLACDDVDGLINIIDLSLSMENDGEFSARARHGWASFCNGKTDSKGKTYKDEFYSEAKVLNKSNYVKGACVYTYTKKGDINNSFCIDPFNFYNKEISYNQKGLIESSIDKENDIEYSFNYERLDEDLIFAIVKFLDNNGENFYFPYEFGDAYDDFYTWKNPTLYHEHINMLINEDKCSVEEAEDFTNEYVLKLFTSIFDRNNNPIEYSYEVLAEDNENKKINKIIPFKITLNGDSSSCVFDYTYDEKEVFKLSGSHLVWEDQNEIANIASNYGISREELLREVTKLCRTKISNLIKEGHKSRCKYFRNLEKYVN